ncbi:hypothetical protein OYC64_019540 [Pagothenia borchgrevinki]|uniref:C2H2-type domain-containing protein n=1 Tax=Pagothenia borchgrevinki TaxID=8213 RepID=A0ABD2FK74_PAGBO
MSKVQMLLSLKKLLLTPAGEEIFALFEKMMAEYEEELSRSKEENKRLQKLLDAVLQPQLRIHRADVPQLVVVKEKVLPDQQEWSPSLDREHPAGITKYFLYKYVQQLVKVKEEVLPDQQEWSTSLDQEDPAPIKQEQEELRISREGEQLQELEEADITKSTFTPDPVKSEDDKEKPQSSQPHQRQTEHMETKADGDDCRGPEPARNSDPESSLQPKTEDDTEPDSADWKETREPASGSNSLKNRHESVSDPQRSAEKKPFSCSVCKKAFSLSGCLKGHMRNHTGEKPHSCSVCTKSFAMSESLKKHMRIHTGEKPYICSFCKKAFSYSGNLKGHVRIHIAEKPYSCSVCKKAFSQSGSLSSHVNRHKYVGRQSSKLNEIQTEDNREAEPPISSSAEHMETEADGEDNE